MFCKLFATSVALTVAAFVAGTAPTYAADADWTGNLVGKVQAELKRHGYDMTFVGGHLNGETRDAISDWQSRHGEAVTGEPSEALLQELRQSNEIVNAHPVHAPGALTPPAPQPRSAIEVPPHVPPVAAAPPVAFPPPVAAAPPVVAAPPMVVAPPPPPMPPATFAPAYVAPAPAAPVALPPAPPGYVSVIHDDFESDLIDPAVWTPIAGTWRDSGGALKSSLPVLLRPKRQDYVAIMNPGERRLGLSPAPVPNLAAIAAARPIGNAFRIEMILRGQGIAPATINVGPYMGDDAGSGYRLVYDGDFDRPLKLLSAQSGRVQTVAAAPLASDFYDGRPHTIVWSRDIDGHMTVAVDGREAMVVNDATIARQFDGFSIVNTGGNWDIDAVGVQSPNALLTRN